MTTTATAPSPSRAARPAQAQTVGAPARRRSPAPPEVAEGVYRLGTKWANFYLVEENREFTLIDAGYPRYWGQLVRALGALGAGAEAIRAVLVTHHHVDHAGTAAGLGAIGARVFVSARDAAIVRGQRPSHPRAGSTASRGGPA